MKFLKMFLAVALTSLAMKAMAAEVVTVATKSGPLSFLVRTGEPRPGVVTFYGDLAWGTAGAIEFKLAGEKYYMTPSDVMPEILCKKMKYATGHRDGFRRLQDISIFKKHPVLDFKDNSLVVGGPNHNLVLTGFYCCTQDAVNNRACGHGGN